MKSSQQLEVHIAYMYIDIFILTLKSRITSNFQSLCLKYI